MELTELKDRIVTAFSGIESDLEDVLAMIEQDQSVFPFNEYEHLICNLINKGGMCMCKLETSVCTIDYQGL